MRSHLNFEPESFSRFTEWPVAREVEFEIHATPVIRLDGFKIGKGVFAPFSEGRAGFESSCCETFPSPTAFLTIQGTLWVQENGVVRRFTPSDLNTLEPVNIVTRAYPRFGVKISHNSVASIGADGTFTTESMLVVSPGVCKVQLRITLELKSGKEINAEAAIQCSTLECFLPFIDSWENRREPWRTHLQFLSATRKMFQPPPEKTGPDPSSGGSPSLTSSCTATPTSVRWLSLRPFRQPRFVDSKTSESAARWWTWATYSPASK